MKVSLRVLQKKYLFDQTSDTDEIDSYFLFFFSFLFLYFIFHGRPEISSKFFDYNKGFEVAKQVV